MLQVRNSCRKQTPVRRPRFAFIGPDFFSAQPTPKSSFFVSDGKWGASAFKAPDRPLDSVFCPEKHANSIRRACHVCHHCLLKKCAKAANFSSSRELPCSGAPRAAFIEGRCQCRCAKAESLLALLAPSSWKLPGSHSTSTSTLHTSCALMEVLYGHEFPSWHWSERPVQVQAS